MDWKYFLKNPQFNWLSRGCLLSGDTDNSRKRVELNAALIDQAGLLDLTHDAILVRELDGTLQYWNQGAQEMYGYAYEDIKGRHLHEFLKTEFPKPKE